MTSTAETKQTGVGEWRAFYKPKYDEWHVSIPQAGGGMRLALFNDGVRVPNPQEIAHLVASAPDGLAAAYATVAALAAEHRLPASADDEYIYDVMGSALSDAFFKARHAIAKAEGRLAEAVSL